MGPGRRIRGGSVVQSTTVDSMPRPQGPPSRMRSMRLPRPSSTWPAVVGESCIERLALGAASGRPSVAISRRVSLCSGQRTATVGPPAVTLSGIRGPRGTITVTGPGQRQVVICSAIGGQCAASDRAIAVSATWTISGLLAGRPLAAKIRSTASASRASAASP